MRSMFVLAMLLLAGCASAPVPSADPPSASTPPVASPSPTPSPPRPGDPWSEMRMPWTLEFEPAPIEAPYGERVDFLATVHHQGAPVNASFAFVGPWTTLGTRAVPITSEETRVEGAVFIGMEEMLPSSVASRDRDEHWDFRGPPLRATGKGPAVAFREATDVSDDPPGLSARMEDGVLRVVFASKENATHTGQERVRAISDLVRVETPEGIRLVAFLMRSESDAISFFPEPQRSRVIADVTDLPSGEITVRVISRAVCFCMELPAPVMEEVRVRIS